MKIDRSKLKRGSSEVPADCKALIDRLRNCNHDQLLVELKQIKHWACAKCELYHWVDLLDMFDDILEECCKKQHENQWTLPCDSPDMDPNKKELLIHVISFTALLIEHSFSRHLYSSMDHLITLMSSSDMKILLSVLGLLFVFSKRSNFIGKLSIEKRQELMTRLSYLAESWGGKENGFGLAECCQDLSFASYPSSATTLHFEYYTDRPSPSSNNETALFFNQQVATFNSSSATVASPPAVPVASPATTNIIPSADNHMVHQQNLQTSSSLSDSLPNDPSGNLRHQQLQNLTYSQAVRQSNRKPSASCDNSDKKSVNIIHLENVDQIRESVGSIMEKLVTTFDVPRDKQMQLFTHLRLAHCFSDTTKRMQCAQARLQAISIIMYYAPNSTQEVGAQLLYNGFIEELVDILHLEGNIYIDIKSAALRTLTAIVYLDRNSRLSTIIDTTETTCYHGFLPILVRNCIQSLINDDNLFPIPYATALFSFLYHLASYEKGGEALVSCGMMESLLKIISWKASEPEHITFVTRSVRVIDLITNFDMSVFQAQSGLNIFLERLEAEVKICRSELCDESDDVEMNQNIDETSSDSQQPMDVDSPTASNNQTDMGEQPEKGSSFLSAFPNQSQPQVAGPRAETHQSIPCEPQRDLQCYTQRAALLKSMLNFLKKAVQDSTFSDCIRHLMDGTLPKSLRHIISNAGYYGSSLFLLSIELVSTYVFQEPALLSTLQESQLTKDILDAILDKTLPPTREILSALPNTFTALCLNNAGLQAFQARKPFEKVFRVLITPEYLPAMRRRKADLNNDTATNLGNSMDELMRHQPSLRADVVTAIINLLKELRELGDNPSYTCCTKPSSSVRAGDSASSSQTNADTRPPQPINPNESAVFSEDEDDDDEDSASPPVAPNRDVQPPTSLKPTLSQKPPVTLQSGTVVKTPVPLVDYILNVMRFVDAILTNNSTDDHVREFLRQDGLQPLLRLMRLRNLPIDFPMTQACGGVSNVCRSILGLARDPKVIQEALKCLNGILDELQVLHKPLTAPGGSVLLEEYGQVATSTNISDPNVLSNLTPLLHSMAAAHAYVVIFSCINRSNHLETRNICINHWGRDIGLDVLKRMSRLYMALVWESTVLLTISKGDQLVGQSQPSTSNVPERVNKTSQQPTLNPGLLVAENFDSTPERMPVAIGEAEMMDDNFQSSVNQQANTPLDLPDTRSSRLISDQTQTTVSVMEVDESNRTSSSDRRSKSKGKRVMIEQSRLIKPLLMSTSRLAKGIAELFALLVKLSVGSPLRHRRNNHSLPNTPSIPSPAAQNVSSVFAKLIADGLSWDVPSTLPKQRLTFFICFSGFAQTMLFDERKNPFHLMLRDLLDCGGLDAFFKTFDWFVSDGSFSTQANEMPSPVTEFLDAWLSLLEKMVNPKTILETPHVMASKASVCHSYLPFDTIKYLIMVQKRAFEAITHLWSIRSRKIFSDQTSDHILSILCHLLKSETIINEHLDKERQNDASSGPTNLTTSSVSTLGSATSASSQTAVRVADYPVVNHEHLQQLIDMGFAEEAVTHVLRQCSSVEQATEFLLSTPHLLDAVVAQSSGRQPSGEAAPVTGAPTGSTSTSTSSTNTNAAAGQQDCDMTSEDSTNQGGPTNPNNLAGTSDQQRPTDMVTSKQTNTSRVEDTRKPTLNVGPSETQREEPLEKFRIDAFTDNLLSGSLRLMDDIPATVYKVCDLILTVSQRNGEAWCSQLLEHLLNDIIDNSKRLLEMAKPLRARDKKSFAEWTSQLRNAPEANKVAVRVHLYSLLFDEMKIQCAYLLHKCNAIDFLIGLLEVGLDLFSLSRENMLTILTAGTSSSSDYKQTTVTMETDQQQVPPSEGGQQDPSAAYNWTGPTSSGGSSTNLFGPGRHVDDQHQQQLQQLQLQAPGWLAPTFLLIDLYEKGAVASHRRAPLVNNFTRTWQFFDERSGRWTPHAPFNNRIIDDAYKNGEQSARYTVGRKHYLAQFFSMMQKNEDTSNLRPIMMTLTPKASSPEDSKSDESQAENSQRQPIPIVPKLNERQNRMLMRVCVGFMQLPIDPSSLHAVMRLSFRLTREYDLAVMFAEGGGIKALQNLPEVSQFPGFVSLATLIIRHVLEEPNVLQQTMEKLIRSTTQHSQHNQREVHFLLSKLGYAACRNEEIFKRLAIDVLRINPSNSSGGRTDEDDLRTKPPNQPDAPQLIKLLPPKATAEPIKASAVTRCVIADLLDSLTTPISNVKTYDIPNNFAYKQTPPMGSNTGPMLNPAMSSRASPMHSSSGATHQFAPPTSLGHQDQSHQHPSTRSHSPLMNHSIVLRLLAELTRSYSVVPKIIAEHTFTAATNESINEDVSALAFILDNILPTTQTHSDRDGPALARVFLASLAACNHCLEAQVAIVNEVKASLARATAMPESCEKHARLQSLATMIGTMIDCCPAISAAQQANQRSSNHHQTSQQRLSNNIVRLFVRKGLVTDLARIPHFLDLSAPHMFATINSLLKPLETLSRFVNQDHEEDEDEDEEDQQANGEASSADEREEEADEADEDEEEEDDDDEEEEDHVDDDEDHVDDDEPDEEIQAAVESRLIEEFPAVFNGQINNVLNDIEEVFLQQSNAGSNIYTERVGSMLPTMYETSMDQHDSSVPSMPSPPGGVGLTHPLLLRRLDHNSGHSAGSGSAGGSLQAGGAAPVISRARGFPRPRLLRGPPTGVGSSWHGGPSLRQPQQTILQQLLGPNTVQEVMTLTHQIVGRQGHMFVTDFQNWLTTDEELYPDTANLYALSSPHTTALATIPLVMARWAEESRILDGGTVHDCLANLNPTIIEALERFKDEENQDRQEKRKKMVEDEEQLASAQQKKCKEPNASAAIGATTTTTTTQTGSSSAQTAVPMSTEQIPASAPTRATSIAVEPAFPEIIEPIVEILSTTPAILSDRQAFESSTDPQPMNTINETPLPPPQSISQPVDNQEQSRPSVPEATPVISTADESQTQQMNHDPPVEVTLQQTNDQQQPQIPIAAPTDTATTSAQQATTNSSTQGAANATQPSTTTTSTTTATSSDPERDGEIPEGVDPSFLAALPEDIRREVLAEQWRLRRLERANQAPSNTGGASNSNNEASTSYVASGPGFSEVNPEFLAALPAEVQEEVLAQQRAEQQRQAALNSNPDQPVDPATFIQTLPPNLRRQVLADMDDSLLTLLPSDLAAEAQALRRELLNSNANANSTLSRLLRTAAAGRMQRARYTITSLPDHVHSRSSWSWALERPNGASSHAGGHAGANRSFFGGLSRDAKFKGRQLLDCEALSCLIMLLFIEEPRLNVARLHRVLRNLSYHQPTRQWIIHSMLSVVDKSKSAEQNVLQLQQQQQQSGEASSNVTNPANIIEVEGPIHANLKPTSKSSAKQSSASNQDQQQLNKLSQNSSWLSISMDAALGCKAKVFHIQQQQPPNQSTQINGLELIQIHNQAAPSVCRHMLEALIALAKSFPHHFFPTALKSAEDLGVENENASCQLSPDFWDVLSKLDSLISGLGKKARSMSKSQQQQQSSDTDSKQQQQLTAIKQTTTTSVSQDGRVFDENEIDEDEANSYSTSSALAKLISFLAHPIIKRSFTLTDRLLHLLAVISMSFPSLNEDTPNGQSHSQHHHSHSHSHNHNHRQGALLHPPYNTFVSHNIHGDYVGVSHVPNEPWHGGPPSHPRQYARRTMPIGAPGRRLIPLSQAVAAIRSSPQDSHMATESDPPIAPTASGASPSADGASLAPKDKITTAGSNPTEVAAKKYPLVSKPYLKLAVGVLTSKSCSEEGLDDVTSLLSRLSKSCVLTRAIVLDLLMEGARQLGQTVCNHISTLKHELIEYNHRIKMKAAEISAETASSETTSNAVSSSSGSKGVVVNRFTSEQVIITAPTSSKTSSGREVQLPSMANLTSKNSSQAFFLRILKVIIQLRETTPADKQSQTGAPPTKPTANITPETSSTGASSSRSTDQATAAMEVDQQQNVATPTPTDQQATESELTKPTTEESLSIELQLDHLWDMLSECLLELAETPDHHAVLVLQPAVEAFFLVHSPGHAQRSNWVDDYIRERNCQTAHIDLADLYYPPSSPQRSQQQPQSQQQTENQSESAEQTGSGPSQPTAGPINPLANTGSSYSAAGVVGDQMSVVQPSGGESSNAAGPLCYDTHKFLKFAETHRVVLNHILRQSTTPLSQGPFAVLVDHTRVLDFDVKRRYFRQELERFDEGIRRDDLGIHVRRDNVFEESFRELHRRAAEDWKNRFFVVFEDEEGQDAGGLLREWYTIISREIFNPMYALFTTSPGDRVTYMINSASHCNTNHLTYFKFVGRVIAKAIYDNKLLDCYFTRSFYKHILAKPVKYTDMESEDYSFYQGLVFLLEHSVHELGYELTFSVEVREFGVTEVRELKEGGANIPVTEENKHEYVRLVCQEKMTGSIRRQLSAFLDGFYDIIPKRLISIFNEQELELLISGLPNIDIDDLRASTEYHKYLPNSLQIQWFWRALRSFDQADRAKLLQFVTGTSKVPLQGFASLEGMNGVQKFQIHRDERSTDRLPSAHTCFNQLDLPVYETYDKLRYMLLKAIQECCEGFGLA